MSRKVSAWFPIAVVLSAVNLAAVWFAAVPAQPLHATIHAGLALGFGLWAQRLRSRSREQRLQPELEPLLLEVHELRQELAETQERLDFAERVLTQERAPRRVDSERQGGPGPS